LREISALAREQKVAILVDAEQTYYQPAISHLALAMMREFNSNNQHVVFNTYQMYLRDSLARVKTDMAVAQQEGWAFCAKLVRGAYMAHERQRAAEWGLPDPIHATIQDTHQSYNAAVSEMLKQVNAGTVSVVVASHNAQSVMETLQQLPKLSIDPTTQHIQFAQLLGMADSISYALAANGLSVRKYLPFGPIRAVLPYLIRRLDENRDVLSGARHEIAAMSAELKRRAASMKLFG
jgi:proline dehydrogenase